MTFDMNKLIEIAKKGLRVKTEIERLQANKKKIYELSRMLPDEEGFELTEIYEQSIKDTQKIVKVANEK